MGWGMLQRKIMLKSKVGVTEVTLLQRMVLRRFSHFGQCLYLDCFYKIWLSLACTLSSAMSMKMFLL